MGHLGVQRGGQSLHFDELFSCIQQQKSLSNAAPTINGVKTPINGLINGQLLFFHPYKWSYNLCLAILLYNWSRTCCPQSHKSAQRHNHTRAKGTQSTNYHQHVLLFCPDPWLNTGKSTMAGDITIQHWIHHHSSSTSVDHPIPHALSPTKYLHQQALTISHFFRFHLLQEIIRNPWEFSVLLGSIFSPGWQLQYCFVRIWGLFVGIITGLLAKTRVDLKSPSGWIYDGDSVLYMTQPTG